MPAEARKRRGTFAAKVRKVVVVRQLRSGFDVLGGKNANSGFVRGRVHPPLRLTIRMTTRIDESSVVATKSSVYDLRRSDFHEIKVRFVFAFARQQTSGTFLFVDDFAHVLDYEITRKDVLLQE